jgi:XTP/dITP diphosphohydrolase
MTKKIIAATNNKGKLIELKKILKAHSFAILSLEEAGITAVPDETGTTFEANARIKAREVFALAGKPVIADDSGLEVDFLNGEPGVYSADYDVPWLLEKLGGTPYERRGARFVCCICYIDESGNEQFFHGICEGKIGFEPKGTNGFGYDPIFEVRENVTMAMLSDGEKNALSHRGNALKQFVRAIINRP